MAAMVLIGTGHGLAAPSPSSGAREAATRAEDRFARVIHARSAHSPNFSSARMLLPRSGFRGALQFTTHSGP